MISLKNIETNNILREELILDLPELYELRTVIENNIWHKESVFDHTLKILSLYEKALFSKTENNYLSLLSKTILSEKIDGVSKKDLFKLIILFHDIAKIDTVVFDEHGITHCPNHEEAGCLKTGTILKRFELTKLCREYILNVIEHHGIPHVILDNIDSAESLLNEKSKVFRNIYPDLLLFCLLDTMASDLEANDLDNYGGRVSLYKKLLFSLIK